MPIVPITELPQVQQSELPDIQAGADAPLEAFGGGRSLEAFGEANRGLGRAAFDIASEEKQKADQLAFISADGQLSAAQTHIQVGVSKMLGKNALQAPDYAQSQWNDTVQKIQNGLQNQSQRMAFVRSAAARWDELNKGVQVHVGQQITQFDDTETSSYLENSRNAAVLNANDDEKVSMELARQKAALADWAGRKGLPTDSSTFQAKLMDQVSGTNRMVLQSRLDKDSPDNVEQAKQFFDAHKSEFNSQDLIAVRKAIDSAETMGIGLQAWDKMQGMKLSDGKPDEARMQAEIYGRDDLSDERKEQVWQFVKARAREEIVQKNLKDAATDRSFMNSAIQARQRGAPLQDALKLADRYAIDPYDQSVKENAVRQIYAPPSQSDPSTYMSLWESVQDGTATRADIDHASQQNKINNGDWRSLREQLYKSNTEAQDVEEKQTWDRVKILAEEKFGSDKKSKDAFLYEMHTGADGETPEEIWKRANDKLDKAPGSGWFGTTLFGQPQWKVDLQKQDAQSLAWGKVYQDVGDSETKAIGAGVLYTGKKAWGLGDVDAFAANFGGYDKIKGGTPANNAIQSLMRRGQLVTPANVKAVLSRHPDGKY